jgi:methyl-accepting chemotaxis protein
MKFFDNMTLGQKMFGAFSLSAMVLIVVSAYSVWSTNKTTETYESIGAINTPRTILLADMQNEVRSSLSDLLQLSLDNNDDKELERLNGKIKSALEKFDLLNQKYSTFSFDEEGRSLYQDYIEKWKSVRSHIEHNLLLAKSKSDKDHDLFADAYRGDFKTARHAFYEANTKLIEDERSEIAQKEQLAKDLAKQGSIFTITAATLGLAFSIFMSLMLSRQLSGTLSRLAVILSDGANDLATTSRDLAASSASISSGTSQQAAALQETAASTEQLSAMVEKNAASAVSTCDLAKQSEEAAEQGRGEIEKMMQAMGEIDESTNKIQGAVEKSQNNMAQIIQIIDEIKNQTTVINDIVFQTKLLSFNASVEAARAGENGKGFSVVAEEVGTLAQMSGKAAHEISTKLSASTERVDSIVKEMRQEVEGLVADGRVRVQRGRDVAERCAFALEKVTANVVYMNQIISEIATGSKDQSTGINEISKAMHQLGSVTQSSADNAGATTAMASNLANQVGILKHAADDLQRTVFGEAV